MFGGINGSSFTSVGSSNNLATTLNVQKGTSVFVCIPKYFSLHQHGEKSQTGKQIIHKEIPWKC